MNDLPAYRIISSPYRVRVDGRASTKFYVAYRIEGDKKVYRAPCSKDKADSRQYTTRYVEAHLRKMLGVIDERVAACKLSLAEHLDAYVAVLRADQRSPDHVRQVKRKLKEMIAGMKWKHPAQIAPSAVKVWLASQRESGRHGLQTSIHWTATIKAFTRWMFDDGRIPADPLARLKRPRGDMEPTFARRALEPDEFRRLLTTTQQSGRVFYGLDGESRAALYLLASVSGFRAQELASLVPASFRLDGSHPTVLLEARRSKRRKAEVQPLPLEAAGAWLPGW